MQPSQQDFGADDPLGAGIHLGLEIELQLVAGQGHAQIIFHAQALYCRLLHRTMEQLGCISPGIFGAVQGDVGALQQVGRRRAVIGKQRDADTGCHLQTVAVQRHGLCEQGTQGVGGFHYLGGNMPARALEAGHQYHELIAAQPRYGVFHTH